MADDMQTLEIPALGRPMHLGMLYDCRTDKPIPGITLWDPEKLKKNCDVRTQQGTQCNFLASNSIDDKSTALDIKASLKASLMGGLVEVGGSAKYINDKKTSCRQSRLTLQYKTTVRFEQLTMKHLGRHNVQHSYVFDQGIGTHVAVGILYGAQAFFVFDRYLKKGESEQEIQGQVTAVIKKIPCFSIEGEGDLKMDGIEKSEADKIQCKFYGDFALKGNPSTFHEAVTIYTQLPSMLGVSGELAVPMIVWLLPLSKLDTKAARMIREISLNLVGQIKEILEGLDHLMTKCNDLEKSQIYTDFPDFAEKVDLFKKFILEFKNGLHQKISKALPKIRGGETEEKVLLEIISDCEQSPFNLRELERWVKCREREMNILKAYMTDFKKESFTFIRSREDLDERVFDFSHDHVVAFSFTSIGLEDAYLKVLSRYLKTQTPEPFSPRCEWVDDKAIVKQMRSNAKEFKEFAKANDESKSILFVVVGFNDGGEPAVEGGSIFVYDEHGDLEKDFKPPGAPSEPNIIETSHDSVTIKWTESDAGSSHVQSYVVKFRERLPTRYRIGNTGWSEKRPKKNATKVTIIDLKPNINYEFKVAATCEVGDSTFSRISDVTTLPCSPPHDVRKGSVSKTRLTMTWDVPTTIGVGVKVEQYRVKSVPVSDPNPDLILKFESEGDDCSCTFGGLNPNTTYRLSVSAVCSGAVSSAYCTPVDVCTAPEVNIFTASAAYRRSKQFRMLIAASKLLKKGNPSKGKPDIYMINLRKGKHGKQAKYHTYNIGGEIVLGKRHVVVMVVGATGAGKSTLINGMINYILGVDWDDNFRFKIIDDMGASGAKGQAHSQTQLITSYTIWRTELSQLEFTLTIIDTPGFGDTRGIDKDKVIVDQIRDFFHDSCLHHIDHLDAICFVAQASQVRLTHTQRYVLNSVLAVFAKDIERNIMLLITFADGQKPSIIEALKAANFPETSRMFTFNNAALFATRTVGTESSTTTSEEGDEGDSFVKMFWKMGTNSMTSFFLSLRQVKPISLSLTQEVLRERQRLEAAVEGIQPKIKLGYATLDKPQAEQRILDQQDIDAPKSLTIPTERGKFITNCLDCNRTCHYPCTTADDERKKRCAVMNPDGNCTICECFWNRHANQQFQYTKERKPYSQIKTRYDQKLTAEVITKHAKDFRIVEDCISELILKTHTSLQRLDEIALRPNPLSTPEYVDILIQSEKMEARPGWQQRVEALNNVRDRAEIMMDIKLKKYNPFNKCKKKFAVKEPFASIFKKR